jgi:hypothetical protein
MPFIMDDKINVTAIFMLNLIGYHRTRIPKLLARTV